MKKQSLVSVFILIVLAKLTTCALPAGFVYLSDIDATIVQEVRYYTEHNFVGRRVVGYMAPRCILTTQAAKRLTVVQNQLHTLNLTLKVYDCYRPQRSVNDFVAWSLDKAPGRDMKQEFFPTFNNKTELFEQGFIAYKSGHSRGSTVDLSIVPLPIPSQPEYHNTDPLVHCFSAERFKDNMIDMGTGFDCLHPLAHTNPSPPYFITEQQKKNRALLVDLMVEQGFKNLAEEWWHYTLQNEPFPTTYFDFEVK